MFLGGAVPIPLFRYFGCRRYCLHFVTDRQTDDSIMPIAVHCNTIG